MQALEERVEASLRARVDQLEALNTELMAQNAGLKEQMEQQQEMLLFIAPKHFGKSCAEAKALMGFTALQCRAAGYTAKEAKDAGFSGDDGKYAGYSEVKDHHVNTNYFWAWTI